MYNFGALLKAAVILPDCLVIRAEQIVSVLISQFNRMLILNPRAAI